MSRNAYNPPPRQSTNGSFHRTQIADAVSQLLLGRSNVTKDTVLLSGTTTTVIQDPRLHSQSFVSLMPKSSSGAALINTVWYSNKRVGSITINHSAPGSDTPFEVLIIG